LPLPAAATGLGLRRALLQDLRDAPAGDLDFLECAPENWIGVGGPAGDALAELATRYPLTCHGLSLSLGSTAPLDTSLLDQVGRFLERHKVPLSSEHLSYCSDDGRRIAVENVSYYLAPEPAMDELAFTTAVLAEADCDLLLDVNNVYVNACNHGYDADAFIAGLPAARIVCLHVAGHLDEAPDLKIDTHGSAVIDPVWALLGRTYARIGPRPTLLERDFNFPPYAELRGELQTIRQRMAAHAGGRHD
jgi:uncharacterized protein (UPF0276 family)